MREVNQRGLRVKAECGGDELRVEGIDEVAYVAVLPPTARSSARCLFEDPGSTTTSS